MNKVYRVVWNARLGVCIAISELTKSTPKNTKTVFTSAYSVPDASSKNPLVSTFFFTSRLLPSLVGLIMGTSILLSTTQAIAAPGMDSLAAGVGAESTGVQSLAAGVNALSSGERSLAAGVGAVSSGGNSLAAGVDAISSGNFSLAVGSGVESAGTTSVAIGFGSESKAASSLAIGQFSQSLGDSSIAVGSAAVSSGASSIAIGQFSQATADNSVALGQGSIADGSTLSTAAYQPLDADGNAIPISLGTATSEVNIGDRRMTGVAAGATDTDAVNVSQLKAVNTSLTANTNNISTAQNQINQGLILSFNGDERTYQLGGTIGLTTDSNILTTATTDGANFALNPNINLGAAGSVTTGATITDNNGLTITGGPSVTTSGINANNSIITQVKAGVDPTDAANVGQITTATAAAKSEVAAGTNLTNVLKTTGANGQDIYTINANGTTASAGSNALEVIAGNKDTDNVTDYAIDLSQETKASLVKADNSVQYDNPAKTSVTLGGADASIPVKLTNVADAELSTTSMDAVNGSQLFETNRNISTAQNQINQGLTLSLNGDARTYQLGDTIGLTTDSNILTTTTTDGANFALNPNINLGAAGSVTTGAMIIDNNGLTITGGPSVTTSGINANNSIITQVKAGVDPTDAANVGQITTATAAAKSEVAAGTNLTNVLKTTGANGQDIYTINANGTTASAGSNALEVIAGNKDTDNVTDYAIDLSQETKASLVKADNSVQYDNPAKTSVTLGGADASIPVKLTNVADAELSTTSMDAVNGSQLFETNSNISTAQNQINQGLILSFNGDERTYQLGGTIGLTTDSNILTTATTDGANFALNPNINLGAAGSVTTGATITDNNGLTITGGPSVTTSGINANNSIITQVKAGDVSAASKDAINGSQLYSLGNNVTNIFGGNAEYANNTISWSNIGGTGQNTIDKSIEYINKQAANANQGWTVTTDSGNAATSTIKPGDNLNIKGDAVSGVTVTNNNNNISIGLGSQVTIGNGSNAVVINGDDSAINVGNINIDGVAGNLTAGQVAVNGKEGTVNGLTNTTWNPNSIVSGQAATEDQLQQIVRDAATAAKSKVSAGSNMTVTPTQNSDGSYDYQVATKKDVSFDSVQVGNVSINASGINAGDKKVGNVSNGAINSTSKDAVNGSQLYTNNTDIYSYFGGGANYDTNTGPAYAVNGGSQSNVGDALNALDNRDNQLDNKITNLGDQFQQISYVTNERIDNVEKNANAGIAAAIALETAPYIAGKYTYAAAAAYHGGENALGISLRKTADNGRWSLTGGIAAASQGDPSVRIGISGVID